MEGLPSLGQQVSVSPAITSTLGAQNCTGLEKPAYGIPGDNMHRHTWTQQLMYRSFYSEIRPKTTSGAGITDITFEPGMEVDQIFFVAVKMKRPAIKGVRADRLEDITNFYPTDENRKVVKADQRAAARLALGAEANDLFGDGASSYGGGRHMEHTRDEDGVSVRSKRSGERRSARARAVSEGVRAYVRTARGGTGIHSRLACEVDDDDAATVRTTDTHTPARLKHYAYFVDNYAYAAVHTAALKAGANILDVRMGRFIAAVHDTNVTGDHKFGMRELVLGLPDVMMSADERRAYLIELSSRPQTAWLIVPFYHTSIPQLAYNNFLSDWSPLTYVIATAPWTSVIRRSDSTTRVVKCDGTELKDTDLGVTLVLGCVQLDPALRDMEIDLNKERSGTKPLDYLIRLHGYRRVTASESNDFKNVNMKWPHAVVAIRWHFQRKVAEADNELCNWDGLYGDKAYSAMRYTTSSSPYQEMQTEEFFRVVQSIEKEVACPRLSQGMLGFAFKNESPYPNGSMSGLKFGGVVAEFTMQQELLASEPSDGVTLYVCVDYFMILRHFKSNVWTLYQRST